jgi:hypothetical protein
MEVFRTDDYDDDAWKKNNLINVSALSLTTAACCFCYVCRNPSSMTREIFTNIKSDLSIKVQI